MDACAENKPVSKDLVDPLLCHAGYSVFQLQLAALKPEAFLMHICCDICNGILRQPVALKECGHHFCHACLILALSKGLAACTVCNENIGTSQCYVFDEDLKLLIDSLFPYFANYESRFAVRCNAGRSNRESQNSENEKETEFSTLEKITEKNEKICCYHDLSASADAVQLKLNAEKSNDQQLISNIEKAQYVVVDANCPASLTYAYVKQLLADESKKPILLLNEAEVLPQEPWEHAFRRLGVSRTDVAAPVPISIFIK